MRRLVVKLVLIALAALAVWTAWPRADVAGEPASLPEAQLAQMDTPRYMGVATCASSACHHDNGPRGAKRSEYSTWAGHDKHAQAYQVLYNDRSKAMARNLFGREEAYKETLCLKCHAMGDGEPVAKGPLFSLIDGVGCESCHGPAEKWLSKHYQADFKSKSISEKAALGLKPTKDLAYRAEMCATCHVGDAATGKDANHDLYAAGHPRLNFEFSAYLAQYPRHWDVKDDKARYPDYEARVWELGQATCARASLELLAKRAESAAKKDKDAVWPEFAEYDCFACHKTLRPDSPRQQAGYDGRVPGLLPWGTWTWATAQPFAKHTNADSISKQVADLRKEMERATPRPAEVSKLSAELLKSTNAWRARLVQSGRIEPASLRSFMEQLLPSDASRIDSLTWDEATQMYLALDALSRGRVELEPRRPLPPDFSRGLRDLRQELVNAFQSPSAAGSSLESPANFEPAKLKDALGALRTNLRDR